MFLIYICRMVKLRKRICSFICLMQTSPGWGRDLHHGILQWSSKKWDDNAHCYFVSGCIICTRDQHHWLGRGKLKKWILDINHYVRSKKGDLTLFFFLSQEITNKLLVSSCNFCLLVISLRECRLWVILLGSQMRKYSWHILETITCFCSPEVTPVVQQWVSVETNVLRVY